MENAVETLGDLLRQPREHRVRELIIVRPGDPHIQNWVYASAVYHLPESLLSASLLQAWTSPDGRGLVVEIA